MKEAKKNMEHDDLAQVPLLIQKMTGKPVLNDYKHYFEPKPPVDPDFKHYDGGHERMTLLMRNPDALVDAMQ